MKKELQIIYFRQDISFKSLSITALSQLVLKILFFHGDVMTSREIQNQIKIYTKIPVKEEKVNQALDELVGKGINHQGNNYKLRSSYKRRMQSDLDYRNTQLKDVLNRYFIDDEISKDDIRNCFDDLNIIFFEKYCSCWVDGIEGKAGGGLRDIKDFSILQNPKIYRRNNIPNTKRKWFLNRYIQFLKSTNQTDNYLLWEYANSLFSSRLIMSDTFVNRSLIDVFKGSLMIVDTNVLMPLEMERDNFADSYSILEDIFIKLSIKPIYLYITAEEYQRAIEYKIEILKKGIKNFDSDVYSKADDIFIKTALDRGCKTQEDFESFYNHIRKIPKYICKELEIKMCDNSDIKTIVSKSIKSTDVIQNMNKIHQEQHKRDKKMLSLEHDAALIGYVKHLRQSNVNAWILSRDSVICKYSLSINKEGELPLAIHLETLINLFAVNDGSLLMDPTNFVPLFANFIRNGLSPQKDAFEIDDLSRMFDIDEDIAELPDDEIISIAQTVNKMFFNGDDEGKIARVLRNRIHKSLSDVKKDSEAYRKAFLRKKEELDDLSATHDATINTYIEKQIRTKKRAYNDEIKIKKINSIIIYVELIIIIFGLNLLNNSINILEKWRFIFLFIPSIVVFLLFNKILYEPFSKKAKIKKHNEIVEEVNKEIMEVYPKKY
jgi:hypothetical protein